MRYKVIALILIIPLMLMFCVFSAANIATIKVPISVSNVSLFHNEHEVINLVEGDEFQINAQVMPRNASNKGLIYSSERVKNKNYPNLNISEDGLVKASGYGTAKISVTTKEGAYKKSFLLEVTSTLASDLKLSLNTEDDIFVGDSFKVNYEILPNETLDKKIKFSSSDSTVVEIDSLTGECEALSSGKVTLYGVIENGLNGRIVKELNVVILPSASNSLITFDGKQNFTKKIYTSNVTSIIEVNFTNLYELGKELTLDDILLEYDKTSVDSVSIIHNAKSSGIYKYLLNINGIKTDNFVLTARIDYDGYREFSSSIILEKVIDANDIVINLTNLKSYVKRNTWNQFSLNITPKDFTGYKVNAYFINNTAILEKDNVNNVYYYNLTTEGTETLVVEIIVNETVIKTIYKEITALNPPSSISFSDSVKEFGIENLLTIGSEKLEDNKYVENLKEFDFTTKNINKDYIELTTSDNSIAEFINGKLKIYKEGIVTITATELQSKLLGINLSCEIDVRCIIGVEVDSYKNLVKATEENKQVVLTKDIMLGEKLIEVNEDGTTTLLKTESECAKILSEEINYIETTGEWNYYKNNKDLNYTEPPLINYIIKFTNNLYGNGFILNANNITNMLDATGALYSFAKFRGPLDLVAIPGASVKAQDNICFIASDNVLINNIELVGANLDGVDTAELNKLKYVGTVLEVMGDNVKIVNSRIRNGRNCVRIFGKEKDKEAKINVLIESCVISYAREFLVKIGTNDKIYGEFKDRNKINLANGVSNSVWEDCAPKLNGLTPLNDNNLTNSQYNALVNEYKNSEEYLSLVKTYVTIKNSVLHTSGLFSVGIETSFAGPALDGGRWNSWNFGEYGWSNIAGTSYPAMLNLEGNVKIYDWKNLNHIDSSILIEGGMLSFNISTMINDLYTKGEFTDIIYEANNEKFAHGGIVLYGGGKNYSLVNTENLLTEQFENYTLTMDTFNNSLTNMIKYASGKEQFRTLMYGKNNEFNYNKQLAEMQSGVAFNDIGKVIV